jgi:hypothetical protein
VEKEDGTAGSYCGGESQPSESHLGCVARDQPYLEPDHSLLNELERQKLVRHHARRLRDLGAEPEIIDEVVERLLYPAGAPATEPSLAELAADAGLVSTSIESGVPALPTEQPVSERQPRAAPFPVKGRGKVCRGKLGFRARQTRNQYSRETNILMSRSNPGMGLRQTCPETMPNHFNGARESRRTPELHLILRPKSIFEARTVKLPL